MSSEAYAGNPAGGKKCASGTLFPSYTDTSVTIHLDFTPTKVMIFLNNQNSPDSIYNGLLTCLEYDFSTNYGFLYGRSYDENQGYSLYYTSTYRPTFSSGTLTFLSGAFNFYSSSTAPYGYTWMAME